MFNPVEMAELARNIVCKHNKRKYYRFRPAKFYGGISTADCVGCCLRCVFCWSWRETTRPEKFGDFYSPEEVAGKLISIAKRKKLRQLRISGNEPTICRYHLISVLELIPKDYVFILETNGILIGNDQTYAEELSRFSNLYVRVSLKGTCEDEFSRLTGAISEGFQLQLKALENLNNCGVNVHPACMISFSPRKNIISLRERLKKINPAFKDFEVEEVMFYPSVEERLKKLLIVHRRRRGRKEKTLKNKKKIPGAYCSPRQICPSARQYALQNNKIFQGFSFTFKKNNNFALFASLQ